MKPTVNDRLIDALLRIRLIADAALNDLSDGVPRVRRDAEYDADMADRLPVGVKVSAVGMRELNGENE